MSSKSTDFSRRLARVLENAAERLEFEQALQSLGANPPIVLRRNRLRKCLQSEYQSWVAGPVAWSPDSFFAKTELRSAFKNHPYVQSGALYWQEGAATEAVEVLDPQPDDLVLDLCAAPGSKATHIAERLAYGQGWLWANEVNRGRAGKLADILARHGAIWSTVSAMPGTSMVERFTEVFDCVLLDAPCSGESLFAKRAEDRADVTDRDVHQCVEIQRGLLENALDLAKPGGKILYSTCTYNLEENEEVVAWLKQNRPGEFEVISESRRWPHRDGVPGGYMALLKKSGVIKTTSVETLKLQDWKGIVTSGGQGWDGEMNDYAFLMSPVDLIDKRVPRSMQKDPATYNLRKFESLEIDDLALAQSYLSGQAIRDSRIESSKFYRLVFKGCPIGGGKGVEGRLNSFLPKGLRVVG